MVKKYIFLFFVLVTGFAYFNIQTVHAAEKVKPDTPEFNIDISEDESMFAFTISKTLNADGYRIYAKEPGSKKYRIVATIKKNRIVEPSAYYDLGTNHKATRHGLKLYGIYWVANEKAGETICVDQNGKILVGELDCNVYEIGVVEVIKVDLKHCNVYRE